MRRVGIIPGDGVGPQLAAQAVKVLRCFQQTAGLDVEILELEACGAAIDRCGDPLPPATKAQAAMCDAVLIGNIGAPKYSALPPEMRPERTLMELRQLFGVCTNLRPVFLLPGLEEFSPLRPELIEKGFRVLVVRDIRGGMLAGPHESWDGVHGREACDTEYYNEETVELTARAAFAEARRRKGRVCSLDKANVLASSVLWRNKVIEVAKDYPDVELRHCYIDTASMEVIRQPWAFDVIVTGNVFGDIIADELAQISGTPALFGSAELAPDGRGIYTTNQLHNPNEALAQSNGACPAGILHATAMLLEHSLDRPDLGTRVRQALRRASADKLCTEELPRKDGRQLSTAESGDYIVELLRQK